MLGYIGEDLDTAAHTYTTPVDVDMSEGIDAVDGVLQPDGPFSHTHLHKPTMEILKHADGLLSAAPKTVKQLKKEHKQNDSGSTLKKLFKKMKKIITPGHTGNKDLQDYGKKEVDVRDPNAAPGEEWVSFGMNVRTVKEDQIERHYVDDTQKDSIAYEFQLRDNDELLMVQDTLLVNRSPLEVIDEFSNLPASRQIRLVTRRQLSMDQENHTVYEYFILKGQFKIIDEVVSAQVDEVDRTVGLCDNIINVKYFDCTKRALRSSAGFVGVDNKKGGLVVDNPQVFFFHVLHYKAYDVHLEKDVNLWVMKHEEDEYISQTPGGAHVNMEKGKNTTDYTELGGAEMKWITVVADDGGDSHVFKTLKDDMYLAVEGGTACLVKKDSEDEAFEDDNTIFHVQNEGNSTSSTSYIRTTKALKCRGADGSEFHFSSTTSLYENVTTSLCDSIGGQSEHFVSQSLEISAGIEQEAEKYITDENDEHTYMTLLKNTMEDTHIYDTVGGQSGYSIGETEGQSITHIYDNVRRPSGHFFSQMPQIPVGIEQTAYAYDESEGKQCSRGNHSPFIENTAFFLKPLCPR